MSAKPGWGGFFFFKINSFIYLVALHLSCSMLHLSWQCTDSLGLAHQLQSRWAQQLFCSSLAAPRHVDP